MCASGRGGCVSTRGASDKKKNSFGTVEKTVTRVSAHAVGAGGDNLFIT